MKSDRSSVWPAPFAEVARLTADWAWGRLWHLTHGQRRLAEAFMPGATVDVAGVRVLHDAAAAMASLPFDAARVQHAAGVVAGVRPRSLLESTRFEQRLVAMERRALGPWARST